MTKNAFYDLFLDIIRDAFDAENQILEALPKAISSASNKDLKKALTTHLEETKNQVTRLKTIFKTLNENPTGEHCDAMEGLLKECKKVITQNQEPAVRDAAIIVACQKVEHYEISTYGSARTIARHLNSAGINDRVDFDEIADILQQTLDEESNADEKLTEVAEGGFFSQGINEEAEKNAMKDTKPKKK